VEQVPTLLANDEKLKDPLDVACACSNFFITIIEKWNIPQIEKGDAISILKGLFPGNFPSIKIIPIIEAKIKCIIHFVKPKKSSGYVEITSKILKVEASLISNHSANSQSTGIFPVCLKIAVVKPLYKQRQN
jgi:hypothetical protein